MTGYDLDQCTRDFRYAIVWSAAISASAAATTDVSILEPMAKAQGMTWQEGFFGWIDEAAQVYDTLGAIDEVQRV